MPVQITITGENANQTIEEFATLTASFKSGARAAAPAQEAEKPKRQRKTEKPEVAKDTTQEPEVAKDTTQEPEVAKDTTQEPEVAQNTETAMSSQELKEAVMKICDTSEKKSAAKALLQEFGSNKGVSEIPEERRADFLARLEAL